MSDNEQMNENRDTVADIVAEMRKESKKVRTVTRPDGYGGYEEITLEGNPYLKNLADRIEAAWKREARAIATENAVLPAVCITRSNGNAASMREALKSIYDYAVAALDKMMTDGVQICNWPQWLIHKTKAVLSAPARNCDVGTAEEQAERFEKFCKKSSMSGFGASAYCAYECACKDDSCCEFAWAQMPYDESEAKNGTMV